VGRKLAKNLVPRDLLTTEEAARLLQVTRVTIHRWLVKGKLKFTKTPGGHRRITRDELLRFAKEAGMFIPEQLSSQTRVVVVDDDPTVTRALKTVLELHGKGRLAISVAEDGFSSLVRAVDEKPDAIILDGVMRGMDGVQACRALKSNPRTRHIVIIAMSGLSSLEDDFMKAGANAFLLKPFESKAVIELLEALQVVRGPQKAAG